MKKLFTKDDIQDVDSIISEFDEALMNSANMPSVFKAALTSAERSLIKTLLLWLISRESARDSVLSNNDRSDK